MYPILKITLPFILGIIISHETGNCISAYIWLTATITALIIAFSLHKNKSVQCIAIYITVFMLGSYLTKERIEKITFNLPYNAVSYEAVIISKPTETNKTIRCDIIITNTSRPTMAKAAFHKDSLSKTLRIGDGIKATSNIKTPVNTLNSNFDYAQYLKYHNYIGTTYISSRNWQRANISISHLPITYRAKLSAIKQRTRLLEQYAKAGVQEESLQIISAMTLGERASITRNTKEAFSATGASHVLALSGMHLSIIYAILTIFMGRRRQSLIGQSLLMIAIWTFVFIVGMPPSAVRAAIMLNAYSFTSLLNRDKVSLNTLAFAAIIILMYDPLYLYDIGFQMSFLAVFSILMLYQPIYKLLPILQKNVITRYLWKITTVSTAAQIGTLPLIAYYFNRIPCYSLIANIIVVPAAFIIICGSIAIIVFSLIPPLQHIVAIAVSGLTKTMSSGITFLSSLPYSSINVSMSVLQTLMAYIIIFSVYIICKKLMPQRFHEP